MLEPDSDTFSGAAGPFPEEDSDIFCGAAGPFSDDEEDSKDPPSGPSSSSRTTQQDIQYDDQPDYEECLPDFEEYPENKLIKQMPSQDDQYPKQKPDLRYLRKIYVIVGNRKHIPVISCRETNSILDPLRGKGETVYLVVTYNYGIRQYKPSSMRWLLEKTRGKKWYKDEVGHKWICPIMGSMAKRWTCPINPDGVKSKSLMVYCESPDLRFCKNKHIKISDRNAFQANATRDARLAIAAALECGEEVGLSMSYDSRVHEHKEENFTWFLKEARGKKWINDVMLKRWTCLINPNGVKPENCTGYRKETPDLRYCTKALVQADIKAPILVNSRQEASMLIQKNKNFGDRVSLVLYGQEEEVEGDCGLSWVMEETAGCSWFKIADDHVWFCVVTDPHNSKDDSQKRRPRKRNSESRGDEEDYNPRGHSGRRSEDDRQKRRPRKRNSESWEDEEDYNPRGHSGRRSEDDRQKRRPRRRNSESWEDEEAYNPRGHSGSGRRTEKLLSKKFDYRCCLESFVKIGDGVPVPVRSQKQAEAVIENGKDYKETVTLIAIVADRVQIESEYSKWKWLVRESAGQGWKKNDDGSFTCVVYSKEAELKKKLHKTPPNIRHFRYCFVRVGNEESAHVKTQTEASLMIKAARQEGKRASLILYMDNRINIGIEDRKRWSWVLTESGGRPWTHELVGKKDKWTCVVNEKGHVEPSEYEEGTPDLEYCVNCLVHIGSRRPVAVYNDVQYRCVISEGEESGEKVSLILLYRYRENFKRKDTSWMEKQSGRWDWVLSVADGRPWLKNKEDQLWLCVIQEKMKSDEAEETDTIEEDINDEDCTLAQYPCSVCVEDFPNIPSFRNHLNTKSHNILFKIFVEKLERTKDLAAASQELAAQQLNVMKLLKRMVNTDFSSKMKRLWEQLEARVAAGKEVDPKDLELHFADRMKQFHDRAHNSFLLCFPCNQKRGTTAQMIKHRHWLPHMQRVQQFEKMNQLSFDEYYPPPPNIGIGPVNEADEVMDSRHFVFNYNQGRETYDPGQATHSYLLSSPREPFAISVQEPKTQKHPTVSDMGDIERTVKYQCTVCTTKFKNTRDALNHFRSPIHYDRYQKFLLDGPDEMGPWFDPAVDALRKQRRKAEREWRLQRTDETREQYLAARRAFVTSLKGLKAKGKVDETSGDPEDMEDNTSDVQNKSDDEGGDESSQGKKRKADFDDDDDDNDNDNDDKKRKADFDDDEDEEETKVTNLSDPLPVGPPSPVQSAEPDLQLAAAEVESSDYYDPAVSGDGDDVEDKLAAMNDSPTLYQNISVHQTSGGNETAAASTYMWESEEENSQETR